MVNIYGELGNTAYLRSRLDEAEDLYRKGLAIAEEFGDSRGISKMYYQIGLIAHTRGRLDEAEARSRLDEAEDWYRKSLAILGEIGDRRGMALTYAQLGLLAGDRAQTQLAFEWNIRCVILFEQFPHPMSESGLSALVWLTRQFGMPALETAWRQVTGQSVPRAVRNYLAGQHHDGHDLGGMQ